MVDTPLYKLVGVPDATLEIHRKCSSQVPMLHLQPKIQYIVCILFSSLWRGYVFANDGFGNFMVAAGFQDLSEGNMPY